MDILFHSKTPEWAWLSNFSPHPVGIQPTAEHAYQASKSKSATDWDTVRGLPTPTAAKAWGRWYGAYHSMEGWEVRRERVMRAVLRRKFTQHPELKWALIGTYPHPLYHLAPWDTYWGVDAELGGANRMGEILMEIRSELHAAAHDRLEVRLL